MLRKTESQPNLAMGSRPARQANLQTRSLLRRAVQAVGQDAKARRAEGLLAGLEGRYASRGKHQGSVLCQWCVDEKGREENASQQS